MQKVIKLIVVAAIINISLVFAQDITDKDLEKERARMVSLADQMEKVAENLRGLKFKHAIKKGVYTPEMVKDYMLGALQSSDNEAEVQKASLLLTKIGLVKPGFNLAEAVSSMLEKGIGGFYDPRTETLNLVKRKLSAQEQMQEQQLQMLGVSTEKIVMVHEQTHAIDDQYFDLLNGVEQANMSTDQQLGYKAIVEGTTGSVQWDYTLKNIGMKSYIPNMVLNSMMKMPDSMVLSSLGEGIPAFLGRQLLWSYTLGMNLVFKARYKDKGGWDTVNKMFENIPASTEQVLHPEKYLGTKEQVDYPQIITYGDEVKKTYGENWEEILKDDMGEYLIWAYFLEYLDKKANISQLAPEAAAGWDADRYIAFQNKKDKDIVSFCWRLIFDTPKDAQEFFALYKTVLDKKYPKKENVSRSANSEGQRMYKFFETKEKAYVSGVTQDGVEILVFETLPVDSAEKIKEQIWNAKVTDWKRPERGTILRNKEIFTPPTEKVESENFDGQKYEEDWIKFQMPRKDFDIVYDEDFAVFKAPETDRSEFVVVKMLTFPKKKFNKIGKILTKEQIMLGMKETKILGENEIDENDYYRWNFSFIGTDVKGEKRIVATSVIEGADGKSMFLITVHGKFNNINEVSKDLNSVVDSFKAKK